MDAVAIFGLVIATLSAVACVALVLWVLHLKRSLNELEKESVQLRPYRAVRDADARAQQIEYQTQQLAQQVAADAQATADRAAAESNQLLTNAQNEAYRHVSAARSESQAMVTKATVEARTITTRANSIAEEVVEKAQRERSDLIADGREKNRSALERADELLSNATDRANDIVERAHMRAQETAGDAMAARGRASEFEKIAKAMRNNIKGYGDEYLVPNLSIIDDLAEEFSYKDAGVKLKTARSHARQMIKNGQAAACDYVEANRKTTAIHFVLDAFNGKVESILTKVKIDNYGKLRQEIEDAFSIVNHNGKAFRDARILSQYLDARLDELRWLVAVNELRTQEREEQRQIKQAMREEERARREYEKAMKEAAKEERTLQKALAEAHKQLKDASEAERQKYEQQLAELQAKLTEAEEKNQRAISMAQQTRRGHVYIISNVGSFGDDIMKIGLTRRLEPMDRVKELGDASVPFPFDVHAMIHSEDAPTLENGLHKRFRDQQVNKVHNRKEFFRVKVADVRSLVDEMGIEAKWTMKAEAQEYRESIALARAVIDSSGAPESAGV